MVCIEALSSLLYRVERNQLMVGLRLTRKATMITHLLFADDSLIFSRANSQDCHAVLNILNLCKEALGQTVNFDLNDHYSLEQMLGGKTENLLWRFAI